MIAATPSDRLVMAAMPPLPTPPALQGGGWLPDPPDVRDFTIEHDTVSAIVRPTALGPGRSSSLGSAVDLRPWCSPIDLQGPINSCTAQAACAVIEYFERRASGRFLDASRLFVYKVTRNLLGFVGDTGAFIRTTVGALALFGVPPERYWPYVLTRVNDEPTPFCYAFAPNFQALVYYRLDPPPATDRGAVLIAIKTQLSAGFPVVFGFTAYQSILEPELHGDIPLPAPGEGLFETHAVAAVGYDDSVTIRNPSPGSPTTTGALLIRNSWGTGWGDGGYGRMPYEYVTTGIAQDFWAITSSRWIDTGAFDA